MSGRVGWQAVVEALQAENVEYVFGLPGGPELYDALYDAPEIKPVLVRYECSAVFMAMAYAKLRRKVGVCYASAGPGVANMSAGILEANALTLPIIVLSPSAAQENDGKGAFQEVDQEAMLAHSTKWSTSVQTPEKIPWAIHRAFTIAKNGKPGPVFVEVPGDVGFVKADIPAYIRSEERVLFRGDEKRIARAVEAINRSEAPIIIAGGGAILSGAFDEVRNLSEMFTIPILTTPAGRGIIPEDYPLALGLVGLYRTKIGKEALEQADLVIGIGTRLEEFQSGAWKWIPSNAKYIQIDVDPFEIGRNWNPYISILGDGKLVLRDIIGGLSKEAKKGQRSDEIRKRMREYVSSVEDECTKSGRKSDVETKYILYQLNKIFGHDTILVNENGMSDLWSYYCPYYRVLDVGDCLAPGEQTCMGFGVSGAIGAKIARPEKKVVCITGDGAFQMYMKELPTAVQYKAPVTWVVLNNFSLGWVKYQSKIACNERYMAVDFDVQPDFVKVAEANKCYGQRIQKSQEVEESIRIALKKNQEGIPVVLDCIVPPMDYSEFFDEYNRTFLSGPFR
jgi:acetolactate synthase-1/2/3 large subunit